MSGILQTPIARAGQTVVRQKTKTTQRQRRTDPEPEKLSPISRTHSWHPPVLPRAAQGGILGTSMPQRTSHSSHPRGCGWLEPHEGLSPWGKGSSWAATALRRSSTQNRAQAHGVFWGGRRSENPKTSYFSQEHLRFAFFFFNPLELLWIYTAVDDSTIWSKVNEPASPANSSPRPRAGALLHQWEPFFFLQLRWLLPVG